MTAQDLELNYFHGSRFLSTRAEKGHRLIAQYVAGGNAHKLGRLLRSHFEEEVGPRSAAERYCVDCLLEYYSLLEIGIASGVFPTAVPQEITASAEVLHVPAVRRYYERHYPLLLPRMFRERISGNPLLAPEANSSTRARFISFLNLCSALEDEDTGYFLDFLEDGALDEGNGNWVGMEDLIALLAKPERLAKRLLVSPDKQGYLDASVQGLLRFLQFCIELDELLAGMEDTPALQSAFWHHHGYWFGLFSNAVSSALFNALDAFRSWVPETTNKTDAKRRKKIEDTLRSIATAENQIARLTSGIYRAYLDKKVFGAGDHPSINVGIGSIVQGRVTAVKVFGCFVEYLPGKEGLCHISELADFRVNEVEEVVKLGDLIWVKIIQIEGEKVRLSRKAAMAEQRAELAIEPRAEKPKQAYFGEAT